MLALNDIQEQIQDSARRFLADDSARQGSARKDWTAVADLGWLGAVLTEEQGGFGGPTETVLLAREIGRALAGVPYLSAGVLPIAFLGRLGLNDIDGVSLKDVLSGERIIAAAGHVATIDANGAKLERVADAFSLRGRVNYVWGAEDADILFLPVGCDNEGPSAIVAIRMAEARLAGTSFPTIDGRSTLKIDFTSHQVQPLVTLDGAGAIEAWRFAMDMTLLGQCAEIVGGMMYMFELTQEYLKLRKQFGQALSGFQALRHRLADMFAELDQADAMLNAGLSAMELDDIGLRSRIISACRLRVGLAARFLSAQAIQLHGGIGLTEEYALGQYYRRGLVLRKMWGDEEYHAGRMGGPRISQPENRLETTRNGVAE
jgi:alkylation response protein AidB-like acyl-CoA dehydrogenase